MKYFTTMNLRVFSDFGWRLVDTFECHYKGAGQLLIYTEDEYFISQFPHFGYRNIFCRKFSPDLDAFLAGISDSNKKQGRVMRFKFGNLKNALLLKGIPKVKFVDYDYMFDSKRFSYKSFAWVDAIENHAEKLCYLDADCHFFKDFNDLDFTQYVNGDIGYFGRANYTETGIIIFDNSNSRLIQFASDVKCMYLSGNIYKLKYWTDCHVFDYCRESNSNLLHFVNLSNGNSSHPIATSRLSMFVDHRKGPRKSLNQSPEISN